MNHMTKNSFTRLMAIAVAAALLLSIIGGLWFFKAQQRQQRESIEANLWSIANLKAKQIADWRTERLSDATILMGRIGLMESIERYFSDPTDQERSEILRRLLPVKERYYFEDVLVVNLEKQVVLSLGSEVGLCPEHSHVIDEAISRRRPLWTALHVTPNYSFPHISVIVPLFAETDGQHPIGAIVLVCDAAQFLYPLIQTWPTASATAETLLVRKDGNDVMFLNELRHRKGTALRLRIPLSQADLPAAKAVKGVTGIVEGKDYRGVEVIAAILPVLGSPWFMVSKVDAAEAFSEWRFRSIVILMFVLGMMVLVLAAGLVFWQRNLKTHYQELYRSENALNKALNLHRITLHSIGDAVISTDSEGCVELMNPVAEKLTGWQQGAAKGKALSEVFHIVNEESHSPVQDPATKVLKEGKVMGLANHTLLISKDGREIPISDSGSPIKDENNEIIGVVLVFKDQTIERQYQKQILENEEKYRLVVENANEAIFIAQDEVIKFPNPKTLEITGYSEDELAHMPFANLVHPEDRQMVVERYRQRLEGENPPSDYVFRIINKVGSELCLQINTALITWEGRPATINLIRDITEQKELEEQVRQAHKMESIGTLAGGIAHEFNNMLGIIIGNSELALDDIPEQSPAAESIQEIRTASLRAKDVVRKLLSVARKTPESRKPVQIRTIVDESLGLLRKSIPANIEIRSNLTCTTEMILADPTEISQVLMNLCTNSVHAMVDGKGVLEVTLETEKLDSRSSSRFKDIGPGDYVKLTVSDDGVGIPSNVLDRIFEPYFTNKSVDEGLGMGLAVVHGIVKKHEGTIKVESAVGKGTTIEVLFPLIDEQPVSGDEETETLSPGTEKILFVDDEASLVKMVSQMLTRSGYEVVGKKSSQEALKLFTMDPDQFDLVITDMAMPGMTGDEVAKQIVQVRPDIPIILCTGHSDRMDENRAMELGIKAFVMKPLTKSDLTKIVRKVLDEEKSKSQG